MLIYFYLFLIEKENGEIFVMGKNLFLKESIIKNFFVPRLLLTVEDSISITSGEQFLFILKGKKKKNI